MTIRQYIRIYRQMVSIKLLIIHIAMQLIYICTQICPNALFDYIYFAIDVMCCLKIFYNISYFICHYETHNIEK